LWDYVARLSAVLSQGQHRAPVALYYPIEQSWTTITPQAPRAFDGALWEPWQLPQPQLPVHQADVSMIQLGLRLLENQLDFDMVDHTLLAAGRVAGGELHVGAEQFRAVLVPAVSVMDANALRQLLALAESGGVVVFVESLPEQIVGGNGPAAWAAAREALSALQWPGFVAWGRGQLGFVPRQGKLTTDVAAPMSLTTQFAPLGVSAAARLLRQAITPDVQIEVEDERLLISQENRRGILRETSLRPARSALKYHRRQLADGDLYFLVNESDEPLNTTVTLAASGRVEEWLPHTGERRPVPAQTSGAHLRLALAFAPHQSRLLVVGATLPESAQAADLSQGVLRQTLADWAWNIGGLVGQGELASWPELGLQRFSGQGVYTTRFAIYELPRPDEHLVLDLGTVLETARVTLNGRDCATLAWPPYQTDITDYLRQGENVLQVAVANTNTNALEQRERPGGLLGPVRLWTRIKS
jgi:hypothetical protein